jgi:uncharacterized membrane protein AbrB (regulator of aidB expression)
MNFLHLQWMFHMLSFCPFCSGHCKVNSEVKTQITRFTCEISLSITYPSMPKPSKHLFLLGLLTTILYKFLTSPMHVPCPAFLSSLLWSLLLVTSTNYKISHYMKLWKKGMLNGFITKKTRYILWLHCEKMSSRNEM